MKSKLLAYGILAVATLVLFAALRYAGGLMQIMLWSNDLLVVQSMDTATGDYDLTVIKNTGPLARAFRVGDRFVSLAPGEEHVVHLVPLDRTYIHIYVPAWAQTVQIAELHGTNPEYVSRVVSAH